MNFTNAVAPTLDQDAVALKVMADTPIWSALVNVAALIGDLDRGASFPEARRRFRQAAAEGHITIWGRGLRHGGFGGFSEIETKIKSTFWLNHKISSNAAETVQGSTVRSHTEADFTGIVEYSYANLRVNDAQIENMWPTPKNV